MVGQHSNDGGSDRRKENDVTPARAWIGLMFLTLGVLGILALTGALNWDQTVGEWWPVAIIGWPIAEMLAARRISIDGTIVVSIGLTLLADEQDWAVQGLMWTLLFLYVGTAILLAPTLRRRHERLGSENPGPAAPQTSPV
jgi:LiaF transmembrane domain